MKEGQIITIKGDGYTKNDFIIKMEQGNAINIKMVDKNRRHVGTSFFVPKKALKLIGDVYIVLDWFKPICSLKASKNLGINTGF